jgi:hypothetical protein
MRRTRLLATLCCAFVAALPAVARADGDPPSDILLGQDAYYPYAPHTVAKELQTALDGMLKAAKAKKFELKVALVASTLDLGAVPQLFTDPQKYANLLTSEIAFNTKPRVLVVLPAGLGGNNLGDDAGTALTGITPEADAGGDGLARAAMLAVGRLTAANGTPVPVPAVAREQGRAGGPSGKGSKGGGTSPLLIIGVPMLLVVLGIGAAMLRGRGDEDGEDEDDEGDGDGVSVRVIPGARAEPEPDEDGRAQ